MNATTIEKHDGSELAEHQPSAIASFDESNPIGALLQSAMAQGVSADTMEKYVDLYMKMESNNARKAFAAAFAKLQSELPRVVKNKSVDNKFKYAPMEDIMNDVGPVLTSNGFSVSFTTRIDATGGVERICAICKLTHTGGHSQDNEAAFRIPPSTKVTNDPQSDGVAASYAKRRALTDALNIITVGEDRDARNLGSFITIEQSNELFDRVDRTKTDKTRFLKLAESPDFKQIRCSKLATLQKYLDECEAETGSTTKNSEQPITDLMVRDYEEFLNWMWTAANRRGVSADSFNAGLELWIAGREPALIPNPIRKSAIAAVRSDHFDFNTGRITHSLKTTKATTRAARTTPALAW